MCLIERLGEYLPGVPSYLLVYSYSDSIFTGFQTDTRANAISGSATVSDFYDHLWNFTYTGTEVDALEIPYVIESRGLYLSAYDGAGRLISHHSITLSKQAEGNGATALGYNGMQLISMLWNNPSRLINGVLKDVQQDFRKSKAK